MTAGPETAPDAPGFKQLNIVAESFICKGNDLKRLVDRSVGQTLTPFDSADPPLSPHPGCGDLGKVKPSHRSHGTRLPRDTVLPAWRVCPDLGGGDQALLFLGWDYSLRIPGGHSWKGPINIRGFLATLLTGNEDFLDS